MTPSRGSSQWATSASLNSAFRENLRVVSRQQRERERTARRVLALPSSEGATGNSRYVWLHV